MIKSEASDTIRRRLKYNSLCPICKSEIKDYQSFEYMTVKRGASVVYRFFHTFCVVEPVDREEGLLDGKTEESEAI